MLKVTRRFTTHYRLGKPMTLAENHPAVVEGRTLFPGNVADPGDRVLKSGKHQRKLGSHVVKGRWAGMPIYTLTLEERKTCPSSCQHWRDCYGNHMQWPKRFRAGPDLEAALEKELSQHDRTHRDGFVVRLHVLGDFYSAAYVERWEQWMKSFDRLHVFGYTARWIDDPIGAALQKVNSLFPDRWWVRFSHRDKETFLSTGSSGVTCPVQTNATACCGTCGLCWTVTKPIRFLLH